VNADYGASFVFTEFLFEKYGGNATMWNVSHEAANGVTGITNILSAKGYVKEFADVFKDWVVANYLDNSTVEDGKYGYDNVDMSVSTSSVSSYPTSSSGSTNQWAADYFELSSLSSNLVVSVDGDDSDVFVGQLLLENDSYQFLNFTLNSTNGGKIVVKDVDQYNKVILIVSDNGTSGGTSYSYSFILDTYPSVVNVTHRDVVGDGINQSILINATDDEGVDTVIVEVNGTNYTAGGSDLYNYSWMPVVNGTHNYTVYVNDTLGSWNSSILYFDVDTKYPAVWNETINDTWVYNDVGIRISINVSDDNVDSVLASHNGSGSWVNYSATQLGTNDTWYYDINSSVLDNGEIIGWRFYANDTGSNWNYTGIFSFAVNNRLPGKPAAVDIAEYIPSGNISFNWAAANDSDSDNVTYNFLVSQVSDFESSVVSENVSMVNNSAILVGGVYFWKVNASDGYGTGNFTDAGNFTVVNQTPTFNRVWVVPSLALNETQVVIWANLTVFNLTSAVVFANSSLGGVALAYSSGLGLWNGSLDANQTGTFNITFNATDIANQSSANFTTLRVVNSTTVSYNVTNSTGSGQNVTVEFIDPETNQTINTSTTTVANVTQAEVEVLYIKVTDMESNVSITIPVNSTGGIGFRVVFEEVAVGSVSDTPSNNVGKKVQWILSNVTLAENATLSFNYNSSSISDASAASLRVYKCQNFVSGSCTGGWVRLTATLNTETDSISVQVGNFSHFMMTLYSEPSTPSSGSGASGFSSAVVSSTPYQKTTLDIIREGKVGEFKFTKNGTVIKEIGVKVDDDLVKPWISVTNLGSRNPTGATPKGVVYKYLKVKKGFDDSEFSKADIRFRVTKEWIDENEDMEVVLSRYGVDTWDGIGTKEDGEDEEYYYYVASVDELSYYVVAAEEPEVVEEEEEDVEEEVEDEKTGEEGDEKEVAVGEDVEGEEDTFKRGFDEYLIATLIIVLLVGVMLAYKIIFAKKPQSPGAGRKSSPSPSG